MHVVRRPVYGGPARQEPTGMAAQRNLAGGPGVLRTPGRRPPHRNGGTFGSFSHERTTIIRYVVQKMAAKSSRQVSCTATPAKANKEKSNVCGTVGHEVSHCVWGSGKPASQFGSVSSGAGCEVARSVRGAANVKVMETHVVRRPVKGGPARIGLIKMTMKLNRAGGPGVQRTPGRRPPHRNGGTFGSFSHERTTMKREVVKEITAKPNPATNLQDKLR